MIDLKVHWHKYVRPIFEPTQYTYIYVYYQSQPDLFPNHILAINEDPLAAWQGRNVFWVVARAMHIDPTEVMRLFRNNIIDPPRPDHNLILNLQNIENNNEGPLNYYLRRDICDTIATRVRRSGHMEGSETYWADGRQIIRLLD